MKTDRERMSNARVKEFTFNCSVCGQPILASKDWDGRQINCPSCNTRITSTAAAKRKKRTQLAPRAKTRAKPVGCFQSPLLEKNNSTSLP
jgi:DNA-directed RNA polymerase subunit RPC12/RpoP